MNLQDESLPSGVSQTTRPVQTEPTGISRFQGLQTHGVTMYRVLAVCFSLLTASMAHAQTPVPSGSRLESVKSAQAIKVAYRNDAKPFSYMGANNEIAGFTIDVCKLVVKSIAQQLGLDDLKIEWVPVTVQTRFSAVASGQADMECGSSTVTLGRMKVVDFSSFVFVESTGVLVRRASNIQNFSDLSGKKIAVVSGTTNEQAIIRQTRQQNVDATVVRVLNRDEGVAAVEAGNVDGFASDKLLLVGANLKNPDALKMLPDDLSAEPYAITLPQGDWALRLAVNTGLAHIYRSGQIGEIFNKWFNQVGLQMGPVIRVMYAFGALQD
jgi:glutamate/aspartate transport system substrate-binding protein